MFDAANNRGRSEPSNWALVRRLLGLAWLYRWGCLKVLAYEAVLVTATVSVLGLTGLGLAAIRERVDPEADPARWPLGVAPPDSWPTMSVVALVGGLIVAIALTQAAIRYRAAVVQAKLVQRIIVGLRTRVYDKIQRLGFTFFDTHESSTIINRVTTDVQSVRLFVDGVMIQLIVLGLSLAFYLAYMLRLHPMLTVACLATTPVMAGAAVAFSRTVRPAYQVSRRLVDDLVLTLSETVQGVRVVKGFAREPEQIQRFGEVNRRVRDQQNRIIGWITLFVPSIEWLSMTNLAVLLVYGGYLVVQDQLAVDQGLVVFAGLLQQFSARIGEVARITGSIQRSLVGAQRVFEVLDTPIDIKSRPGAARLARATGSVVFERVDFAYEKQKPVLHGIDLEATSGSCTAILGATGAGKSTLLSLIPRFYDPTAGRVLIDGIDVRDLQLDDLRRQIGIVFQETFLFSNTVAANVAFGYPEADFSSITRAAKIAGAHEFITRLPNGYDTVIGENGVDLSGGQRQRLAIARAVLLEPPILLLDDPTAAIDAQTEQQILLAMDEAMSGRTTFVVAHRLSTLRRADRVVVLEHGRVVQAGRHDELMVTDGHYRDVVQLQVTDMRSKRLLGVATHLDPRTQAAGGGS